MLTQEQAKKQDLLIDAMHYAGLSPDIWLGAGFIAFQSKCLMAETDKEETKESAWWAMGTIVADFGMARIFDTPDQFYSIYRVMDTDLDLGSFAVRVVQKHDKYAMYVSDTLLPEYTRHLPKKNKKGKRRNVLVADGERFIPVIRQLAEERDDCDFTIATVDQFTEALFEVMLKGCSNTRVISQSIYRYDFLPEKFDYILALPVFGMKNLTDEEHFICKESDAVALENLLLHLNKDGRLVITVPGRITFGQGRTENLRAFVQSMYQIEEITELPSGTFKATGIKTYLMTIGGTNKGDDVSVRRLAGIGQKNKRDMVSEFKVEDETFVLASELDDMGDWNVDRIFSQQDEEWVKFRDTNIRKETLGDVAEIFRGKLISKKDKSGSIGVLNISNIGDYEISFEGIDHIEESERKIGNYILQEGDLIIPARGTVMRCAVFRPQSFICIASSNLIVIRTNPKMLLPEYLKIFLDSPIGRKIIISMQQGTTTINLNYKDLAGMEVPMPALSEQKKSVELYEAEYAFYRESIEKAETRWNETLQRLYKF
ncbi:MAG: restriction endonuclease subunit S [Lacrimispora saccharolytica]|uniref:restriction endonuclease subunit S n=1 Tax=Lachnospiraceae TaxID=186803 RepID=UPI00257F2250|nr:restriction endonuclease subunit S [Sellimonas sp.]